jgi:hypothetical protein
MNWIKYSGIWVTLVCNPFHWNVAFRRINETEWPYPKRVEYSAQFICLSIRVVVDNGSW